MKALIKIEKETKHSTALNTFFEVMQNSNIDIIYDTLKSQFITDDLICGKGSSHIWIKEKNNINDRIAIITFSNKQTKN